VAGHPGQLAIGERVDGRFVVEAPLGAGGVASVYRVRDDRGRRHALKYVLAPQEHVAARFLREGRVQASVSHPNVVGLHEAMALPGGLGLLLDLVEGPSLEALIARSGPLGEAHADALALGLFRGLAAAHAIGVVHRDLKPANVLLGRDAKGRPIARIADFGLAKGLGSEASIGQSMTGMLVGTPAYMAPEQARDGKHVDARADVFSLGTILYRMVTGRDAFEGASFWALFEAVQDGRYPPPEALVPTVPARHAAAVRAALRPEPAERVGSVEALADLWFARPGALVVVDEPDPAWPVAWLAQEVPSAPAAPASAPSRRAPVGFTPSAPSRRELPKGLVPALVVAAALGVLVLLAGLL
jgi:serine/threonine-protein kinase